MNRIVVENSSNVAAYGYDPVTMELVVEFKSKGRTGGALYKYEQVPWSLVSELNDAESKGSFIQQKVVRGGFKFIKAEPEPEL